MFLILCVLAVEFCVVMSPEVSDNTIVSCQPLGLQMCVKLCSTHGRCRFHTFDPVQLKCTPKIMTVKSRSFHGMNLTIEACRASSRYSGTIHPRQKGLRNVTKPVKVSRYKKADKMISARNKKADRKGAARNDKADKKGAARNDKPDKKGVARNKKADKNGAARNKKADNIGAARNTKADKNGATRNAKIHKKAKDVTHKRRTYYMPMKKMTWYQARDFCKNRGSTLVMPKTKEEADDLVKYIHDNRTFYTWKGGFCCWLGLSDVRRNTFFWTDGVHTRRALLRAKAGCGTFFIESAKSAPGKDWHIINCRTLCLLICQK